MIVIYRLYAHVLCYIHVKNNNVNKHIHNNITITQAFRLETKIQPKFTGIYNKCKQKIVTWKGETYYSLFICDKLF